MFDTKGEPCGGCGREADECVCPPDFPDDPIEELDTDYLDWGFYEEDNDEGIGDEDTDRAGQDCNGEQGGY